MARPRTWLVTGVYGAPTQLRLATDGQVPPPGPEEEVEVVELGSWRAILTALHAAVMPYSKPRCSCCWDYPGPSDDCPVHGRGGPEDCFTASAPTNQEQNSA
jgi:hypothetical protein